MIYNLIQLIFKLSYINRTFVKSKPTDVNSSTSIVNLPECGKVSLKLSDENIDLELAWISA